MPDYTQKDIDRAKSDGQLSSDILYIKTKVETIEQKLEKNYVTHEEFQPVKNLVYGLVGLILTSVILALVALVIVKQ